MDARFTKVKDERRQRGYFFLAGEFLAGAFPSVESTALARSNCGEPVWVR
jgi:hypothetical protein